MNSNYSGRLAGWDIHGFHTMEDLDMPSIMQEAGSRWLRPNEIHAILSNYTYFTIYVKPVNLPKGGTLVLFDRKKLRNFRKDGHNWKKKKDGKTVKEAHERLKVGTEERIHVYYAHGEDNTTFVRRCYWLLDKDLEHIVLVHYRETQELQGSPATPVNSDFGSDYKVKPAIKVSIEAGDGSNLTDHEMRLHEINTLEWDDLLESNSPEEAYLSENTQYIQQYDQHPVFSLGNNGSSFITNNLPAEELNFGNTMDLLVGTISAQTNHQSASFQPTVEGQMYMKKNAADYDMGAVGPGDVDNTVQRQDSLARWINHIVADSPESVDEPFYEASVASNGSLMSSGAIREGSTLKQIFSITDISPQWASSSEQTKILVAGFFHQEYQHLGNSKIFCICGDTCVPAEVIQVGVLRCWVPPHPPGLLNFYLSLDQCTPISEVLTLEFHSLSPSKSDVREVNSQWDMFRIKMRLASLLFSKSKSLDILSSKVSPNALMEGKKFAVKYSKIADSWAYFASLVENGKISFERAKDSLFELAMKSRLKEWLLERIVDESKITEHDAHGQGVLHLCAILGYTWAIYQYSSSGLSLDFRDKFGWTALHWAAYYGREKMVAALLSAGAKPNLVTDPTPENPGGCTAADLASKQGFEGIAAYLSEKALVQQFEDMKIAGNASGSLDTPSNDETVNAPNISEEEICLKDTLTAYRTAADAAARIQVAFRAHSLQQRTKFVESNNPEDEARCIVAAMKIQHAYRNYDVRKKMVAAARIQYRFRTWKMRREFLNMRRHAIKIQAAYRGYRERRQYKKICWSVGVLEKALFRWRLKRKGLRGLRLPAQQEPVSDEKQESDAEEDFYCASRKQAEERVDKAVRRIQGMFRSLQAQQDYHRMKLTHRQAELEYEECTNNHDHLRQV